MRHTAMEHARRCVVAVLLLTIMTCQSTAMMIDMSTMRNLIIDRLSTSDGLSQAVVKSIAQDDIGFIWLGTQEGLNRFDGYQFTSYFHDSDVPASLASDEVYDLLIDSKGTLWIGTRAGLDRYDRKSDSFTHIAFPDGQGTLKYEQKVHVLFEDDEFNLWIGTSHGVVKLDRHGHFEQFSIKVDNGFTAVLSIVQDSAKRIWAGTLRNGLFLMNRSSNRFEMLVPDNEWGSVLESLEVRDILEVHPGTLWIATIERGIFVLDTATNAMTRFGDDISNAVSLDSLHVRSLIKDRRGDVWMATGEGVKVWFHETGKIKTYRNDITDINSLSDDMVLTLFEDKGGVIWAGTYSGGVSRWNSERLSFPAVRRGVSSEEGISSNQVTSFAESLNGDLWIGTLDGLNHWNQNLNTFTTYRDGERGFCGNIIMSLFVDNLDRVWVGTKSAGVNVLNAGAKNFVCYANDPADDLSISSNSISSFYQDANGDIWITTYGGGLNRYLESGHFAQDLVEPVDNVDVARELMLDMEEDDEGNLWIATAGDGVLVVNIADGRAQFISQKDGISGDYIIRLHRDRQRMWIGTLDEGLDMLDLKTRKVESYNKASGLASSSVYGMLMDDEGKLWVSGNRGISVLNPETRQITNYDTNQGLQGHDFNHGAALRLRNGSFLFGGSNGFNLFNPLAIKSNAYVPPIVLTRFTKFNKKFDFGVPEEQVRSIELAPDDTVIGFEFASLDFTSPERNRFRYKLEGFDRYWVEVEGSHVAGYTNLQPGEYEFRVVGSNNDGTWNTEGLNIAVVVNPPWWATWWARCSYIVLVLIAGFRIWKSYTRYLQREAAEKYQRQLELYIDSLEEASDCVLIADSDLTLIYTNQAVGSLFGCGPDSLVGKNMLTLLCQKESDAERFLKILESESRCNAEISLISQGTELVIDLTMQRAIRGVGQPAAYVAIARDVSERKRNENELEAHRLHLEDMVALRTKELSLEIEQHKKARQNLSISLEEKKLLITEIHHRVKNNMQVISSLVSLQAHSVKDERFAALLGESQQRIRSMALIHENLYQTDEFVGIDFQDYTENLVLGLQHLYSSEMYGVNTSISAKDILLDIDIAVPCGLIINELVSNALKHAFIEYSADNFIEVSITFSEGFYYLRVKDNGRGFDAAFDIKNATSLGMDIVSTLVGQLDGHMQIIRGTGAEFRVMFPGKELWRKRA